MQRLQLKGTSNLSFNLNSFQNKKIIFYFYPKDSTPGCTIEGNDFSKLQPEFTKLNAVVFGISRDHLKSHENFKQKQCFQFELLSDPDEDACKAFDVIQEKNMYGKKVIGIERSTFILDSSGKILAEWRGVKVTGHAQEVLEKIQSLDK